MKLCAVCWWPGPPLLRHMRDRRGKNASPWLIELLKRKPPKLVAVAVANKIARIAWKLMVAGEHYRGAVALSMPAKRT